MFRQKTFAFSPKKMGNQGSLTVQFLLGIVLILSFMSLFLMMTLTLAVSEIVQYITYSSSRQLFLGHETENEQKEKAKMKYKELTTNKFKFDFNSNTLIQIKRGDDITPGLNPDIDLAVSHHPNLFYGVWTEFIPKILSVDTLWGGTDFENPAEDLKTTIGSYLGREPSEAECQAFNRNRWGKIKDSAKNNRYISTTGDNPPSDNGC